ncbi:MAG: hypothetical protein WCJ88_06435 [Actinomycetes bacterium]
MTIRKGSDYGDRRSLAQGSPIATSDAELHDLIADARNSGCLPITIGLVGGDLCRTLGGPGDRARLFGDEARQFPIDLILATVDGSEYPVVSHLIAGTPFGRNFASAMNAQWWGALDLGPRSHPGDGLIDLTTGSLRFRQRHAAIRRARTGTHLPHPMLSYRRASTASFDFDRPTRIVIDSTVKMVAKSVSLAVEPDAFSVVV